MRRSLMAPSSAMASLARSSASATGSPWKLPPLMTRPWPVARASCGHLAAAGEDERVVRGRVHLDVEHAVEVAEGVADGAVDLGHAAQRVGVLDAVAVGVVRALQLAVAQQPAQLGGGAHLAGMRSRRLVGGAEGDLRAAQRLGA